MLSRMCEHPKAGSGSVEMVNMSRSAATESLFRTSADDETTQSPSVTYCIRCEHLGLCTSNSLLRAPRKMRGTRAPSCRSAHRAMLFMFTTLLPGDVTRYARRFISPDISGCRRATKSKQSKLILFAQLLSNL